MTKRSWILILAIVIGLFAIILPTQLGQQDEQTWPNTAQEEYTEISLDKIWTLLEQPETIEKAGVLGRQAFFLTHEGETLVADLPFPASTAITEMSRVAQVPFTLYENPEWQTSFTDRLWHLLPILILISVLILLAGRGVGKSLGLTSAHTEVDLSKTTDSFDTVGGLEHAKDDLHDIIRFLKDPKASSRLGAKMPKGVLFAGPPGTGKTLLARALAKEAGVKFLTLDASSVNQIFVGAGAMKIRALFRHARKVAPCILFVDEIDALAGKRGVGLDSGGRDEKDATLNALLVELDGFQSRDGVILIGATNLPDRLDDALLRPGRFDRRIDLQLPDLNARAQIFEKHLKGLNLTGDLTDISTRLAKTTFGFSGAQIAGLVNEAALLATRRQADTIEWQDFSNARERVLIGAKNKHSTISDKKKWQIAIHESGHAAMSVITNQDRKIEQISIVPQGGTMGHVLSAPQEDENLMTKSQILAHIDVLLAGKAAERVFLGKDWETVGAQQDLKQATDLTKHWYGAWGFEADSLGFKTDAASLEERCDLFLKTRLEHAESRLMSEEHHILHIARTLMEIEKLDGEDLNRCLAPIKGLERTPARCTHTRDPSKKDIPT